MPEIQILAENLEQIMAAGWFSQQPFYFSELIG